MIRLIAQLGAGVAGAVMVAAGVAAFALGHSVLVPMAGFALMVAGASSMVWAVGA